MNREIKFKAKRIDSGEWIEGDLVHSTNYIGIGQISRVFPDTRVVHRVDPNTVCQFTGGIDMNGKELYENDIISFHKSICYYKIAWSDEYLAFRVYNYSERCQEEGSLADWLRLFDCYLKGSALDDKEDNNE